MTGKIKPTERELQRLLTKMKTPKAEDFRTALMVLFAKNGRDGRVIERGPGGYITRASRELNLSVRVLHYYLSGTRDVSNKLAQRLRQRLKNRIDGG